MTYTQGFYANELNDHFLDHQWEFGGITLNITQRWPINMWANPKPTHVHECVRKDGCTQRFDPTNDHLGVIDGSGHILTLFKPIRCSSLTPAQLATIEGPADAIGDPDNLTYFFKRCKR